MDERWWSVGLAGVAAAVAAWQAWEARRDRQAAEAARDQSAEHERRALEAAESSAGAAARSATATERLAADAERQARARARWEPHHRRGEWAVVNETGNALRASLRPADGEEFLTVEAEQQEYKLVGPSEGLPVQWAHRSSPNNYARVVVRWVDADSGLRLEKTVTLASSPPPVLYAG